MLTNYFRCESDSLKRLSFWVKCWWEGGPLVGHEKATHSRSPWNWGRDNCSCLSTEKTAAHFWVLKLLIFLHSRCSFFPSLEKRRERVDGK